MIRRRPIPHTQGSTEEINMVAHIYFKSQDEACIQTSRVTVTDRATLVVGTIGSREFNEWDLAKISSFWVEEA
jgi:hypothetical protein